MSWKNIILRLKFSNLVSLDNKIHFKRQNTHEVLLFYNVSFVIPLQSLQQTAPVRSLHRFPGPGWQFHASPSTSPLCGQKDPSRLFGPFTLHLALLPPQVHSHSRKDLWSLTLPTFLSITTLGASSIRPSGLENSSANSIQIPGGYPLFVPAWQQREDYFHHNIIASDLASDLPSIVRQSSYPVFYTY